MGRPERPINGIDSALAQFAQDLRALREKAGNPSYRELAAIANFSATTLSKAADGRTLPSAEVLAGYVRVCEGDVEAWLLRRAELAALPRQGSAAHANPPAPDAIPRGRRRPTPLMVAAAAAVVAVAVGLAIAAVVFIGPGGTDHQKAAADGTDPYADGCKADHKQLDWQPVTGPDGAQFGTLVLYFSPTCQAAWGYLNAPNSTAWTTHVDAHRVSDKAVAPSQFSGNAALGSWGNVLSTVHGCVYVEAWVVKDNVEGPHSRTACVQPAGSVSGG